MKPISTTLVHRVLMPEHSAVERHPTLILLHGRGADEEDLIGLAPYFGDRLLVLSARAPFEFPHGGYTWYDFGVVGMPVPGMFNESYDRLSRFVDDVLAGYPVDPARIFLLGFSMGTVMSYAMALTKPALFRGVSANSGYIPEGTSLTMHWNELAGVEFCIAHGTEDPVIPIQMGRRAKELLEQSKARFTYREYPMGHQISDESLSDAARWIRPLLD